ncbi:MAG: hypothetical protein K6E29_06315 [Cyanobacteria bacterium RUI128]|nr:hypothetical protein [Cyanobacteria bacterium RUI128]
MTVSFTGVNNVKVLRVKRQGFGLFQGADREIKQGNLNITEVKLRFTLTNDAEGKDMDELQAALKKAGRSYSYDPQKPDTVELHLKNIHGDDGVVPTTNSLLSLNCQDINITKREDLGLYTYLAKLTQRIGQKPDLSPGKKEYTNMIHDAIHNNAVYYIDNVM